MKICSKCNQQKQPTEFGKRSKNKDGLNNNCKKCTNSYETQYRKDNKEKVQELNKKYYNNNKEKFKQYYSDNIEKIKHYNNYYNSLEENIEKRKLYRKKEYNLKYGKDVQYTLSLTIKNRINLALKENWKKGSTIQLLGISILEYKQYLESKFTDKMNWENYGTYWEIDHIKQLATFDLSIEKNQIIAFNYKNTRPLSILENQSRPKFG